MKTIKCDNKNWERVLNLVACEQHFAAKLSTYKRYQELQLKVLEEAKDIGSHLIGFKDNIEGSWWNNLDPEMKKAIEKYSRGR